MVPQEINLLDMLKSKDVTFFIPPFQRNYEWTTEQCKAFLDDVRKTYEINNTPGGTSEHFFGSITFFQTETAFAQPDKLVLIDGQQRITTTMLFLAALRDVVDDTDLRNYIDTKWLRNDNVSGDSEYKIKLKQVESDWPSYKNIILGKKLTGKDENAAVCTNYRFFVRELKKLQKNGINLELLAQKGLSRFNIITIELTPEKHPWENPQEIFESMNSLGKPLSLADLVRNYLLIGFDADTQCNLYKDYWLHIEQTIPGQVSNFIRDYMQMKECHVYKKATDANHKELYGLFKRVFFGEDPIKLLEDLSYSADIYSFLLPEGTSGNEKIDRIIKDLNTVNATTAYSFILKLLIEWRGGVFNTGDVLDILDAFRIYCLRRRLVGLVQGENIAFAELSSMIPKLAVATNKKRAMFEILSKQQSRMRLPNDLEISRYLETFNFYNFAYSKFYLSLIEEKITKSRPDISDGNLQLEHIMPQKLTDTWKRNLGFDQARYEEFVNTIGNITLIRHNQELSNKSFLEKKVIYEEKAGLQIAKTEIINHVTWTIQDIKQRAKWVIRFLIDEVLTIPDDMRKVNNYSQEERRYLSFEALSMIGSNISYIDDPTIIANVTGDKDVEFEGKRWRLSTLTAEIKRRRGEVNSSGVYKGPRYWTWDGMKISELMNQAHIEDVS